MHMHKLTLTDEGPRRRSPAIEGLRMLTPRVIEVCRAGWPHPVQGVPIAAERRRPGPRTARPVVGPHRRLGGMS